MFKMFHCCSQANSRQRLADVKTQVEEAALQAKEAALLAKERLLPLAEAAVQKARPVVDGAWARVGDVVDADVKPRLAEWREQATPKLEEAASRGRLAVAALKGDIEPAPVAKRRHPVIKAVIIATVVGAVLLLLRALLDARDEGWELQDVVFDETAEDDDEVASTTETGADDPNRYGEGSFIGAQPPDGFDIKGNERSMKYHIPTAIGYERCVTDIWFNSPVAAERAGFTRALR